MNGPRLKGIDCPEKSQAFSGQAKHAVSELPFGKQVTVESLNNYKYNRTFGDVILLEGTTVNYMLVKDGLCWWYQKYASRDTDAGITENDL